MIRNLQSIVLSIVLCLTTGFAQTYVGSNACAGCHGAADLSGSGDNIFDEWTNSGHPYKFNQVIGGNPPDYPNFVVNFEDGWMSGLGADWDDISGVIGGFGWKARFVDNEGFIAGTASSLVNPGAGHNQLNFFGGVEHGWVNYEAGTENKRYNYSCFRCHTTGPSTEGSWLDGMELGDFAEQGIGCEACHGPASDHVANAFADPPLIDRVYEFDINNGNGLGGEMADPNGDDINFMCGTCHNRNFDTAIDAGGGFVKHHEQWDEFSATRHSEMGFNCTTCHNPHKRVIWEGEGISMQCQTCHPSNVAVNNHPVDLDCMDCHMPYAAKSGTTIGESGFRGDVRSHLFAITSSAESMFNEAGNYVRDDEERSASLDLQHACLGCHNDDPDDDVPDKSAEELVQFASTMHENKDGEYVGSDVCAACHTEKAMDWYNSGHPYKFNVIENNEPPIYPNFVVNYQDGWMTGLGADWDQIAGVIGGFGWKTRFVDQNGVIAGTASSLVNPGAGHNQFNFFGGEEHGWVNYEAGTENKLYNYNCFKCHTTGPSAEGSWLAGLGLGDFAEQGVGCEACHGPGGSHMASADASDIDRVYEFDLNGGNGLAGELADPDGDDINFLCGTCHNRNFDTAIDAGGGFVKHHEQWDEFSATAHNSLGFTCATCHDPHKRTIWDGDAITMECETCHPNSVAHNLHPTELDCIDCHMPYAAKSGTTIGESGYRGDVRSHLFRITATAETMFNEAGNYVRDDEDRAASLDLQHACLGCHNDDPNDNVPDKAVEEIVAFAGMMHDALDENNFTGPESCLSCHTDKAGWRQTMHANGYSKPLGENSMVDLYGIVNDANQNGIDDFMDGLDMSTVPAFAEWGMYAPILGYDADTDTYTITIGDLTMPVLLTYGGSGLYKQRYVVKVPLADMALSDGHYMSPIQYNEKTDEYVTYHPEAWWDNSGMPIYGTSSTAEDIAGNSRSFEKGCVGCHFTGTEVSQTAAGEWISDAPDASAADIGVGTYDVDGDGTEDLINNSCERCHGAGGAHFGDPAGIVNPADLTAEQSNDLCGFCHSRGKSFPNETLSFPYNDTEGAMHDWVVGDLWADYYIDHGGYYGDGGVDGEIQSSRQHHQQYFDFLESSKPTFPYHQVRCSECHDVHNAEKHQMRTEIVDDGLVIATDNDNNTLCLACHASHGPFEDLTKEMIADYEANVGLIGEVVSEHTHHDYDPEAGLSRCSKCHNAKTIKSAVNYDIHSHTFEVIPPYKTLDYAMPNACSVSCHRSIENGDEPIFETGVDLSLSNWSEASDIALAEALLEYYGPCGEWWGEGDVELLGDVNFDCETNIIDIVMIVEFVLDISEFTDEQIAISDVDGSGEVNILDIVDIIGFILGARESIGEPLTFANVSVDGNQVLIAADGNIAGIQLDVSGEFSIVTAGLNGGWEIQYSESTILLYSLNGSPLSSGQLFTFDGNLNIESGIVADWHGNGVDVNTSAVPEVFALNPAYPNPFNPSTTISFGLPEKAVVEIKVHDMLGRELTVLTNDEYQPGTHHIVWNADSFSSGVYMISMTSAEFSMVQKVMLVK